MKSTLVLIFAHGFDVTEKFEMSLMCLWIYYQVVLSHHHHLIYCAGVGASSTSVGSPPGSWLAAGMADLTLDLHTSLSQGSTSLRFHSQWSLSVNVFHDILGHSGPCFPSICISQAVLIAWLS